jgi:uncharacterized UPF0160 family protein
MRIGTHNGEFHADDLLACAALLALYPYAEVVRTRDAAVLAACDVLVDVGGTFDSAKGRFDHHQREGAPSPRENGIKLSSFGLVWREFGAELAGDTLAASIVDRDLVQGVDALDNGQGSCDLLPGVKHSTLSGVIATLNPTWEEVANGASYDAAFTEALDFAKIVLRRAIASARAEAAMLASLREAARGDAEIVVMPPTYKGDGFSLVGALADEFPAAKFAVFVAGNGEWSAQAVPPTRGSFAQRCPFPSAWGWKRGADLAAVSGVADAIFSHGGGFFACAVSREGAFALCKGALAAR